MNGVSDHGNDEALFLPLYLTLIATAISAFTKATKCLDWMVLIFKINAIVLQINKNSI